MHIRVCLLLPSRLACVRRIGRHRSTHERHRSCPRTRCCIAQRPRCCSCAGARLIQYRCSGVRRFVFIIPKYGSEDVLLVLQTSAIESVSNVPLLSDWFAVTTLVAPSLLRTKTLVSSRFAASSIRFLASSRTRLSFSLMTRSFGARPQRNSFRQCFHIHCSSPDLVDMLSMVRRAGAREVHFRVASPPVTSPCFYGMDFPSKGELLANQHDGVDAMSVALGTVGARAAFGHEPNNASSSSGFPPLPLRRRAPESDGREQSE